MSADDVGDHFLALFTNGKVSGDDVGPHSDLLSEFPYVGPPHASYSYGVRLRSRTRF